MSHRTVKEGDHEENTRGDETDYGQSVIMGG